MSSVTPLASLTGWNHFRMGNERIQMYFAE